MSHKDNLNDAIKNANEFHPLPRCHHRSALMDGAGEYLEPPCGCRLFSKHNMIKETVGTLESIVNLKLVLQMAYDFIGYARYKLEQGKSRVGDQFPRQEDANIILKKIDELLNNKI